MCIGKFTAPPAPGCLDTEVPAHLLLVQAEGLENQLPPWTPIANGESPF